MRDLVLSVLIPAALIWGLCSARASILVLNWLWFQRPYDFSWGMWNTLPVFKIALGIAMVSNLIHGELRPRCPRILVVYLAFLTSLTISTFLAYEPESAWAAYWKFLPSMWVAPVLLFATIRDLDMLRWVLWISAGSIGVNAFKVGAVLTAKGGGHVTEQISGFIGDNNVFGVVLCLVIAILIGLRRTLNNGWWVRVSFYAFIVFIGLCIVYTQSRGALVSLGVVLFLGSVLGKRRVGNTLLLMLVVIGGYVIIPSEHFDRLASLRELSSDRSSVGRVENWVLSWREALDHPFFGVGPENHIPYNRAMQSAVQVRVAHSVYFQVLGELGFLGLGLYSTFVGIGLWSLFSTWRAMIPIAKSNPDLAWVRDCAFWMTCGYAGYSVGSATLNMLYIEFPWYAIFYGSMLWPLVKQELALRANNKGDDVETTKGRATTGRRRAYGRGVGSNVRGVHGAG